MYDNAKVNPFLTVEVTADVIAPNLFVRAATQLTPKNPEAENAMNNKKISRLPFSCRYEEPVVNSPVYTFIKNTSTAAPVYE